MKNTTIGIDLAKTSLSVHGVDARGNIMGLHSKSEQRPWARVAMKLEFADLAAAERYADWIFTPRLPPP